MDAADLIRPEIATMEAYTPIFPFDVLAARLGRAPDALIKLDANENPYGPAPGVREALADLQYAHIYPDPQSSALRTALAEFTGLPADVLLAGAGADELIDLTMRLFLQPGDAILDCPPTFGMYPFDAAISGARVISIPRRADFSLDLDGIEAAVARHKPKLVFVASPNNPDGGWLPDADLERLLALRLRTEGPRSPRASSRGSGQALPLVVVLDEAYVEFAGMERSRIRQVPARDNLIVLRTFSKWAGLAGLRIGYGAYPATLMPHLWKIKQPYNVSVAASTAAIAALEDRDWLEQRITLIVKERRRLWELLDSVPYLHPYPTRSNFVLCRVVDRSARDLKIALEQAGILIRYLNKPGLRDHVRVSVGRPEQTDALVAALRRL